MPSGVDTSCFVQPVMIENIKEGTTPYREEFFGPVFNMFKVSSEEEAIEIANDSEYGLGGAVFSQDLEKAE